MTPARAREILEAGNAAGEYRKHMTIEEEDHVYDIWSGMQRSSSFKEVLTMIAEKTAPSNDVV
jgi:hypothetical protein